MANQAKAENMRVVPLRKLRQIVREVVREELCQTASLYFIDANGVKVSLVRDEEAKLKVKPIFKQGVREAIREIQQGRTVSIREVRRKLKR